MDLIATGMVSSLGYDVHTACAAARAGLARATELAFTTLENDRSAGPAIGHPVPLLAGGFEGDARLVRLLDGAFRDLNRQLPIDLSSVTRLGFYLALPSSSREREGLNLIGEDARPTYLEFLGSSAPVDEVSRATRILAGAIRMAGLPSSVRPFVSGVRVSTGGHAAVIGLFQAARSDLDAGRIDLAIVGGVDSLVSHATLRWLQFTGRLKSAESPAGLSPGEGAALIALSRQSLPGQTAPPQARIASVVTGSSATQFLAGEPADGQGQFQILQALTESMGGVTDQPWVIADQNGEVFRASDWGCALVRLRAAGADRGSANLWHPAASFGDTGAATGAIATCMAVEAHQRRYAPSPHAFILSASDASDRTGCVVTAVENES